jgi:hypothetical protein
MEGFSLLFLFLFLLLLHGLPVLVPLAVGGLALFVCIWAFRKSGKIALLWTLGIVGASSFMAHIAWSLYGLPSL